MKRIAKYLRISNEDKFMINESSSITNQRLIIDTFIQKNEELLGIEIEEFVDDGYSGTNMERPGIITLLEKVKMGEINCIIVKDLSRFSRDYLIVGKYLEQIFPFMNVRFISINDDYDSINTEGGIGEIDNTFKALLNDFYAKDVSEKVLSNYKAQTRKGKAITWSPPYGYMKDPNDKHKYIIDEETAPIIRKIYKLALEGHSLHKIAKLLSEAGEVTPAERKKMLTNMDYSYMMKGENNKKKKWNLSTLSRITSNKEYIGWLIKGMTTRKEVGSRKRVNVHPKDWIVVKGHHEPIISEEVFNKVQEIKETRLGTYNKGKAIQSPIKGLVTCKNCGRTMRFLNLKNFYYINCRVGRLHELDCKEINYNMKEIEEVVLKGIQNQFNLLVNSKKLINRQNQTSKNTKKDISIRIGELSKRKKELENKKRRYYEDYKAGDITRTNFTERKKAIEKDIIQIEEKTTKEEEKYEATNINSKLIEGVTIQDKFIGVTELTDGLVKATIDEIILGDNKELEIRFKV
ncbi:MAG: recombinase family protein [Peptoniphilaceae bacterium]